MVKLIKERLNQTRHKVVDREQAGIARVHRWCVTGRNHGCSLV